MPYTPDDSGKGVWWVIHLLAYRQKNYFPDFMATIRDNFFCPTECKPHLIAYIQRHPIPRDPRDWFVWTVNLHNDVNRRIGKRVLSVNEAIAEIDGTEICERCNRNLGDDYTTYASPHSRSDHSSVQRSESRQRYQYRRF
jgi:hypothetical protein